MRRFGYKKCSVVGVISACLFSGVICANANTNQPNIIFILADDVGIESMTPYGGSSWNTPNIDSIATDGMRFERAFATPTCAPTRAEFLTGRYPFRTGITFPNLPNGALSTNEITLASILKGEGYSTGLIGKWNLSSGKLYTQATALDKTNQIHNIESHGFDYHYVPFVGHTIDYGDPSSNTTFTPFQLNEEVCNFIKRESTNGPFYLQYSLGLVHTDFDGQKAVLTKTPVNYTNDLTQNELYAGMMEYMDEMVGNVLTTIDSEEIGNNTLVVFAGDNGTWQQISSSYTKNGVTTNLFGGKLTTSDISSWVPFYARWPGKVTAGSINKSLMDFSDIFSTFIEVGGGDIPTDRIIDGISFYDSLTNGSITVTNEFRDFVYCSADLPNTSLLRSFIRDTQYKLVDRTDLYCVSNSPIEEFKIDINSQTPEQKEARSNLLYKYAAIENEELNLVGVVSNTQIYLEWDDTMSFNNYRIVATTNLATQNWVDVSGELSMTNDSSYAISVDPNQINRFYRLEIYRDGDYRGFNNESIGYSLITAPKGFELFGYSYTGPSKFSDVFAETLPIGSKIYLYNGSSYNISQYINDFDENYDPITRWSPDSDLDAGLGFWIEIPTNAAEAEYEVIFAGNIISDPSTNIVLAENLNLIANPYPESQSITNMNFDPKLGDKVYLFNGVSYNTSTYSEDYDENNILITNWSTELDILSDKGFWYETTNSYTWEAINPIQE